MELLVNVRKWIEENKTAFLPPVCNKLIKLLEIRGDDITSLTKLQPELAKDAENHSNITEEPKLQEQSKSEGCIH
uniref:Uncharacterized protein n=1 Tax=Ficedula albicollis TaxID=59894 RepID=A0A803VHI3_FICAL